LLWFILLVPISLSMLLGFSDRLLRRDRPQGREMTGKMVISVDLTVKAW
jgi:hypothetical protein